MRRRSIAAALLSGLAATACSAAPPSAPVEPARPPAPAAAPTGPARWLVPDGSFVERTADGLDLVVVGGRRLALRGLAVVESAPRLPEVQGGAVAPPWAGAGPQRYVFWKGRALYGAASFTGELRALASLPGEPRGSFDWLGGVGLLLPGGAAVIAPGGASLSPLPLAAAAYGFAADARRALAVDVLGRAALTLDGGATFRDVTGELGPAPRVALHGDALAVTQRDGRERFILPSGEIVAAHTAPSASLPDRSRRPAPDAGAWPPTASRSVLDAAVNAGLPLPDGGAVIVDRGFVGRLDLTTLRAASVTPIPAVAGAECVPIRQGSAVLLVCGDKDRATVVDVTGTPRIERTFDVPASPKHDRFTGSDDGGLGFLGPCDPAAPAPRLAALPDDNAAAPGRSAVFCARASRDTWIEHRLDPDDAAELLTWIPRPGGGAVALVARSGSFLRDPERVEVRGALRIVRVARSEPPLSLPPYGLRSSVVLDRAFHADADSVLDGWIPSAGGATGQSAVTIDARGHVRAHPLPLHAQISHIAGAFGLISGDDDQLFETTDRGHTWVAVEPPPGEASSYTTQCSPVGCRVGAFVRLGWSSAAAPPSAAAPRSPPPPAPSWSRPPPPPALVALRCRFDGAVTGRRAAESSGFGVPPTPPVAKGSVRLGQQGSVQMNWNSSLTAPQGDAEIAWISPLDPAATIRRVTLALGAPGLALPTQRPFEARLGYLLEPRGELALIPTGRREICLDGLLDRAGVTRSLGGCAGDQTVGVELADRLIFAQPLPSSLVVSSAASPARPTSLRELARHAVGITSGFSFGVGARGGAPVLVAVDVFGEALLAPIDPARGALGPSERLRPLTALALGKDPSCKGTTPAAEARVVLPFESSIGLVSGALPGVTALGSSGVAVIRWSKERACLDAVEMAVRDERYETELSTYDPPGSVRKLIARFDAGPAGKGSRRPSSQDSHAGLVLITPGSEIRQPITCDGLVPAAPPRP
jgi:hypothetical protein